MLHMQGEVGGGNPQDDHQQFLKVKGMSLRAFKKDDGGNMKKYPNGQGGQHMSIALEFWQLGRQKAPQRCHQGKEDHK